MEAKLTIREDAVPTVVRDVAALDAAIAEATAESLRAGFPNIIFVKVPNGNELSFVVGAAETVLGFTYAHLDPPYYVSKGVEDVDAPVLTAFVGMSHHTEYPRRWVIPLASGMLALHEFVGDGNLPCAIQWEEP